MRPARTAAAATTALLLLLPAYAALRPALADSAPEKTAWVAQICRMSPGQFKAWLRARSAAAPPAPEQAKNAAAYFAEQRLRVLEDDPRIKRVQEIARPVLRFHGLEGKIEFVVFAHRKPLAYSLPGVWTALSTGLLDRIETEEQLRALVAHEIGHRYFQTEYRQAAEAEELSGLRQVELASDAVASATMVALGENPTALEEVLGLMVNYSADMQRGNDGTKAYPALASRAGTIREVKESLGGAWGRGASGAVVGSN